MNDASKNDELPFLELNEEIPAQWAIEPDATPSQEPQRSLPVVGIPDVPSPRLGLPQYTLTMPSKVILSTGAVLVLLMITFRVPPALVLLGIFSVLRVLFFPLAILGFVLWAWRQRR